MKNICLSYFFLLFGSLCLEAQPSLSLEEYASGFVNPVVITNAGDERLFVAERKGVVWELDENGVRASTAFLDIEEKVNSGGGEQGLLGLTFSPDFENDGRLYVYYTTGIGSGSSVVARYNIDALTSKVDTSTREILMTFKQPFNNHNGGDLHFGKDGYLYISSGDGGSANDPQNNAQNKKKFLGKILRIDVSPNFGYVIPSDNPFATDTSGLDEIWALGLRNPWRFSFDRLNGDLWIGDVGQDSYEEVNYLPSPILPGANFGWRCYEADKTFNLTGCESAENYVFPIYVYSRGQGYSITGGFVYRGSENEHFQGNYIMADYVFGRFWIISPKGNEWHVEPYPNLMTDASAFGENKDGELFVAQLNNGKIFKIVAECSDTTINEPQIVYEAQSNILAIDVTDPKHHNLQWYFNGEIIPGARASHHTPTESGTYTLEATYNKEGCLYRSSATINNVIVGLSTNEMQQGLEIYPNPSSAVFHIVSDDLISDILIYSSTGRLMNELSYGVGQRSIDLELERYVAGVYYVAIKRDGNFTYAKLMKGQ